MKSLIRLDYPSLLDAHVGRKIQERRLMLEITAEQLAALVAMSANQLLEIEKGQARPSASQLVALSRHLNTGVAYFFEGCPSPLHSL